MKSKEELLTEEVRSAAQLSSSYLQWGVTLMISVQTALFFIRHEILAAAVEAGRLPKGSDLPLGRYFLGTAFLFFVAAVLSRFSARNSEQYRHYKKQLIESRASGIKDLPIKYVGRWSYLLYFAFPVIDLLVRGIISIRFE
jgi:hypothetical protein